MEFLFFMVCLMENVFHVVTREEILNFLPGRIFVTVDGFVSHHEGHELLRRWYFVAPVARIFLFLIEHAKTAERIFFKSKTLCELRVFCTTKGRSSFKSWNPFTMFLSCYDPLFLFLSYG